MLSLLRTHFVLFRGCIFKFVVKLATSRCGLSNKVLLQEIDKVVKIFLASSLRLPTVCTWLVAVNIRSRLWGRHQKIMDLCRLRNASMYKPHKEEFVFTVRVVADPSRAGIDSSAEWSAENVPPQSAGDKINMSSCLSKFRSCMGPYHIHRINDGGTKVKGNGDIREDQDAKWPKWFSVGSSEDVHVDCDSVDRDNLQVAVRSRHSVLSHSVKCSSETVPSCKTAVANDGVVKHEAVFSECKHVVEDIVTEVEQLVGSSMPMPSAGDVKVEPHDDHVTDVVFSECYQVVQDIVDKVSLGSELPICNLFNSVDRVRFMDRTRGRPTSFYAGLWRKLCSGTWPENNISVVLPARCRDQASAVPATVASCTRSRLSDVVLERKSRRQPLVRKPLRKVGAALVQEATRRSSRGVASRATSHKKRNTSKKSFYAYQYLYSDDEVLADDSVWDKTPPKVNIQTRSADPTVDVKKLTYQLKYPPCVVLETLSPAVLHRHLASGTWST